MKKASKFIKISVLTLLVAAMSASVIGCDGCNGSKNNDDRYEIEYPDTQTNYSVTLDRSSVDMVVGDVIMLKPSYEAVEGMSVSWNSEHPSIASVDGGIVEALSNGETKITATYGDAVATCTVKVTFGAETPSISLADYTLNLSLADTDYYTLTPKIHLNGKDFSDGEFKYVSSDESKLKVENGKFIPIAATDSPVTVAISATWRGFTVEDAPLLSTTVSVSVLNDFSISSGTAKGFFKLYTRPEFEGQAYENTQSLNASLKVNGTPIDGATFSATVRDEEIATYDEQTKTVRGVKYGKTYLDITARHGDVEYNKSVEIYVERPVAAFSRPAKYFSAYSGMLKDESSNYETVNFAQYLFGKDTAERIVDATADGEKLTVKDGGVLGIEALSNTTKEVLLTVSSEYVSYEVVTTVYGAYVCHPADLSVFVRTEKATAYNGYVELGRNVDATDFTLPEHTVKQELNNGIDGFKGTLDGKGHSIKNLKVNSYGLFASLSSATVKNVAFIDCKPMSGGTDYSYSSVLAFTLTDTTLENVYVKCDSLGLGRFNCGSVIASHLITGGTFKHVVIESSQDMSGWGPTAYYRVLGGIKFGSEPTFDGCFVLSKAPLSLVNYDQALLQVSVGQNVSQTVAEGQFGVLWDNVAWQLRRYWLGKTVLSESQFKGWEADPNGTTYNYNAPFAELSDEYKTLAKNRLLVLSGIKAYGSMAELSADSSNAAILSKFSTEYWTVKNGALSWGESTVNAEEGVIVLDVGEAAGKTVYGLASRQIAAKAGDTVTLPVNLTCPGLKFVCWKNAVNGKIVDAKFEYDGSAMHLVAIWEVDDSFIETPTT